MLKKMVTGLLALFLSATMAYAVEVGGVEIAETLDTNTGNLVFNGAGIRKKFGFKVYVGALYLKAKTSDSQAIINADENMAIQMTWKRSGPVNKVVPVYEDGFVYSAGENLEQLKPTIKKFLDSTVKAAKGDVWVYEYIPGKGVKSYNNGKFVRTFKGLEFKKALFGIWLLENDTFSGDEDLRDGMLGKN